MTMTPGQGRMLATCGAWSLRSEVEKMGKARTASQLQEALETVESLPDEEQMLLVDVLKKRLVARRRAKLVQEVRESRAAYKRGDVRRGSVQKLMEELGG